MTDSSSRMAADAIVPAAREVLFNGRDLSGWQADMPLVESGEDDREIFTSVDNLLVANDGAIGHLITDKSYRNYQLELEYRLPPDFGNSSVLVHVSKLRALRTKSKNAFPQAIEIKLRTKDAGDIWCVQEDIEVADMWRLRPRVRGQEWGGGEDDARHILKLADAERRGGQWNSFVLRAYERTIKVWLNGVLVVDGFNCTADRGRISLQAGGNRVEFRNVVIKPATMVG